MFRLIFTILLSCAVISSVCVAADINCAADAVGCCCRGTRGNVDCDYQDIVDIADLTLLIDHMFISLQPLPSIDEANIDGEGEIDISDLSMLIDGLYISLRPFPNCPGPPNHPPTTLLVNLDSTAKPLINAVGNPRPGTGVTYRWTGSDRLDHPYTSPSLRYEWRVYGPYDSVKYAQLRNQFIHVVLVTPYGQLYYKGHGDRIPICDTTWIPAYPPEQIITCDTLLVDTVEVSNRYVAVDTLFDISAPAFVLDSTFNRIAVSSGTDLDPSVLDTTVTLTDLFRNYPSDVTICRYFIFWLRARDPDNPLLFDPTPISLGFQVIDPKFERDIYVVDAQIDYQINPRVYSKALTFWDTALARWNPAATWDYYRISQPQGNILYSVSLLSHKVVVVLNDDVIAGLVYPVKDRLIEAMKAGVSIWMCGRNQFYGSENGAPKLHVPTPPNPGREFGVVENHWSGWTWYLYNLAARIEDFNGARSVKTISWPDLDIDTSYLHSRYIWDPDIAPWRPDLAALPEVNFFTPVLDAEVLYTYKSIYSDHHPILPDSFFYAGQPVVYRLSNDSMRVFASAFTPYAFNDSSANNPVQVFVDSALNWLIQPFVQPDSSKRRGTR
jgi:L-fucose mutarotase/ribose pyranase (RbsD/FucU family)